MTGPTSVAGSDGSPIRRHFIAPISISIMRSAISSCRYSTRSAEQRWPALVNAEAMTSSTTCSAKRSGIDHHGIEAASLCDECRLAAPSRAARVRLIAVAVAVEPVSTTPAMAGCPNAISLNFAPPASGVRCSTSPGTPASCSTRTSAFAISGVGWAGLAITAFPAINAAVTWPPNIASGKFQGLTQTNTPRPCRESRFFSPVGPRNSRGEPKCSRPRAA